MKNFPYNKQFIDQDDIDAVTKVLKSNYLTSGPEVSSFERELANYVGAKYVVACSSGTAALHLSMLALGIKKEDKVLTSPISFAADGNAALYVGANVVFSDVEEETINLDCSKVRLQLENDSKIKAIIPVHFSGHPVNMVEFKKISDDFNIPIVDDACHALGASYLDEKGDKLMVGNGIHSSMSVFSFHAIKNITTGEGGAISTNDKKLYEKLTYLRSHGIIRDPELFANKSEAFNQSENLSNYNQWYYEMQHLGFNYRITDIQCALGRSQLKKLDSFILKRRKLVDEYRQYIKLNGMNIVKPLHYKKNCESGHHLFVVRINFKNINGGRNALMRRLSKEGISTQVHYIPIYKHPYYKNLFQKNLKIANAEKYYDECLSLPLYVSMKNEDPKYIIDKLISAYNVLKK